MLALYNSLMAVRTSFWLMRPSLLKTLWSHLRLSVRLMREPHVRWWCKTIPLGAVAYVLSPVDILPDVLPLLGQLDDIGLLGVAVEAFLRTAPSEAVQFHRSALAAGRRFSPMPGAATVIDAQFRRG
jgi:uncharacterized membrane protein YkvA (DUF1232 family)